ncbi:MAG: hypothetical protein NVS9B15_18670 [Acidobacteriaceae bacterium]
MRNWLRERMRRRKSKAPNESESFGRVGQELPQRSAGQLAPLQPSYSFEGAEATKPTVQKADKTEPKAAAAEPADSTAGATSATAKRARRSRRGGRRRNKAAKSTVVAATAIGEDQEAEGPDPDIEEPVEGADDTDDFGNEFAQANGKLETETQPDSTSVPPAAPQPLSQDGSKRPSRGIVVLAIGLPGSGKTTWFKRRGVVPLSSDMLRNLLFDDITEQRYQGLVFSTLRSLLRARLIAKMPWNYVDASNLSPHERRQWIKMAHSFGYDVHAVFFNVPIEVCLARNARRERRVDEEVIRKMSERLRPPSFKEGFSKIVAVKVKDPQKAIEQASHPPHLAMPDELEAE